MNRFERAGLAALAAEMLDLRRGEGKALCELVVNAGRFVEHARLDECSGRYESAKRVRTHIARRLPTRIARIRKALEDVGFPPSAIENNPGVGYAMPVRHARRLIEMLECAA